MYNFEKADVGKLWQHFDLFESECKALLDEFHQLTAEKKDAGKKERTVDEQFGAHLREQIRRFPLLPAADLCLKCSHLFNILDARGAISVTERVGVIARVRALAVGIAKAWMDQQYGADKTDTKDDGKASATEKKPRPVPVG